jgi:hypothetical protein
VKRNSHVGAAIAVSIAALAAASAWLEKKAVVEAAGVQAPRFEVDPMWPKPLPNHWILGNVIGVSVDSRDHIWIIHRQDSPEAKEVYASTTPPGAECCLAAPPVLEFDEEGNLLAHWGGSGATSGSAATAEARTPPPRLRRSAVRAAATHLHRRKERSRQWRRPHAGPAAAQSTITTA